MSWSPFDEAARLIARLHVWVDALPIGPMGHPELKLAAVGALGFGVLTAVLVTTTLLLRARFLVAERRRQRFIRIWRPLIMEGLLTDPPLPRIQRYEWNAFLLLWNHLHESLRGEAKERLNTVARRAGAVEAATRFMGQRGARRKLLAIMTLGNLREVGAWRELELLVGNENAYLSLVAMRALTQIDAKRAAPLLVREIARRENWPSTRVATLLNEIDHGSYVAPMIEALPQLPEKQQVRLLRYLSRVQSPTTLPMVKGLLALEQPAVLAAALPLAGPRDLPRVRDLLAHPAWFVRVQAAVALGRIGVPGDDRRLVALLGDPEWWVRYRAAHALIALPFVAPEIIEALRTRAPYEPARDIMNHVIAEGRQAP